MIARSRSWPAVLILLAALLSANIFYSRPAQAHSDVDINIFYDALAPYGTWVDHSAYGRVWYPRGVAAGWRPYTDGHWAYNDQYGWLWVSDWAWGWAPFHYGRWAWDDWYGWIWVPGRVWAPAWVFWRYGGGYAAWAPMPPNAYWQPGYGLNTRYFDYDRDLRRHWWVSVPDRHLHDRYMRRHLIDPRHNDRVLNVTKNFVNVTNVNNIIVNQGVPKREIEKRTGRRVRSIPIREVERPQDRRNRRTQDALTVIRPKLAPPDADDIRRQEEIAQKVSSQNEQRRNQGRPDGKRTDTPPVPVPGRLRKGAPDSPPKGDQTIMPSFDSQPGGRPVQPADVDGKPQRDRRGDGRPDQPQQFEERRRQDGQTQRTRDEAQWQRQLQERKEQQRRQQEQTDRARDEAVWRQKIQEREQQRQQRQLEEQRRQQEQADRAREEAIQQRQLQQREEQQRQQQMRERQEQQRQQQLQQRQMEEHRRQAEQAERAREEAIRQRQLQQQQLQEQRRQQLQQQRQFEEQRRQQQINMQRQQEMQQRQMEIQRQQNEQRRRQESENAEQQRRQQQPQQMPR